MEYLYSPAISSLLQEIISEDEAYIKYGKYYFSIASPLISDLAYPEHWK